MSLHINAGFGKTSSGFELYYPGFKEEDESPKKKTRKAMAATENKYLNDTVKLARLVQKNLDSLFPRKGRGLREADVPLAEGLPVPVLTVELGFATNPEEKKKLASGKTQTGHSQGAGKEHKVLLLGVPCLKEIRIENLMNCGRFASPIIICGMCRVP